MGQCNGINLCMNTLCPLETQCMYAGVCNYANGICDVALKPNGTVCDDGNNQTMSDVCSQGTCMGIPIDPCASVVCMQIDDCHMKGACSGGVCSDPYAPNGTVCDGGLGQCALGLCVVTPSTSTTSSLTDWC